MQGLIFLCRSKIILPLFRINLRALRQMASSVLLAVNSRLCRCYTLMTFTPLYPIYPTQFDIRQTGFDKIPLLLCGIRHKMISAEFFIFIDIFPAKTYNNIRDGKPSSGEFLPDSGKLYIQESSCQTVENFINQEIPCQTVGNFKIEG